MMPPLALLAVFVVLIGWPLIKLVATIIARPRWRDQKRLRAELLGESSSCAEKEMIEAEYNDGKGSALQLILPPVAFFGGIAAAFAHAMLTENADEAQLTERFYYAKNGELPPETIRSLIRNPLYRKMSNNAFELAMLRYPICTLLTVFALIPAAVIVLLLSGFKASLRTFATAAGTSSRQALRAFEKSFEGCYRGC